MTNYFYETRNYINNKISIIYLINDDSKPFFAIK